MKIHKFYNYYFVANVKVKNAGVQQFAFDCTCAHEIPTWDDIQSIKKALIKKKDLAVEHIEDVIITFYTPMGEEPQQRWCALDDILDTLDKAIKEPDNHSIRGGLEYVWQMFTTKPYVEEQTEEVEDGNDD